MSAKKILHICLSNGWGGLEMYPVRISREQQKLGWSVFAICIKNSQAAKAMTEAGVSTFEVTSKLNAIKLSVSIHRWLKEKDVNYIHCHKSGDLLLAAILDSLGTYKIFFTDHMGGNSPKKDIYHRWVHSHVNKVFSISDFTRERNLRNLPHPEENIQRLWLGTPQHELFDDANQLATMKQTFGIPQNALVIGIIGRIDRGKGHQYLVKAFAKIKQKYNVHLLIVGGLNSKHGSDESFTIELKQQVKDCELEEFVHFSGYRDDTPLMYALIDIVCILSKSEAFGLTVIEAMMAEKFVLGANSGAIPEILQQPDCLVKYDDTDMIAQCLESTILGQIDIKQIAKDNRQRALKHFTISSHTTALLNAYDS